MPSEITLPQAARRLQASYATVYRLVLTGAIRARQDRSGRWWLLEEDVHRVVAEHEWADSESAERCAER